MADYRAIMGVSEAIVEVLRANAKAEEAENLQNLDFEVFTSKDFAEKPISNGASLFIYRVYCNGDHRIPAGRVGIDGHRTQTQLPLELHFLITIWGQQASLQYTLAGWLMRTLEDTPILAAGILNSAIPGVFHPEETINISLAELRTEDLFRIWEILGADTYQLSIPYIARVVNIESTQPIQNGEEVQYRIVHLAKCNG